MPTQYTNLLGFALPQTGELTNTWGTVVNNSITELVEDAIAATATASVTSGDWTLSTTGAGASNEARCAIIIPTGSPGTSRNVIAPNQSKAYVVINQSDSAVVFKGTATTGVTIASGVKALVAWNGSDFVSVGATVGGSNTQVQFNSSGSLSGSSNFTFNSGTGAVTATSFSGSGAGLTALNASNVSSGTLAVDRGGTGAGSFTSGGLLRGNGTSALSVASASDIVTAIGSTAVTNATNIAGGGANQISYNTGAGATSFITAPTSASTFLQWTGSAFSWAAVSPGGVSSVTASSPIASSGGSTPNISLGTVGVSNGGTNITTYNTGDTLFASASNTLSKLGIGTSGQVLTVSGAGIPTWATPSGGGAVSSVSGSGSGISVSPTTGAVVVQNTGVTSLSGSNIGVSSSTGAVTLTLSSGNVTSALGFTPYNASNPNSYTNLNTVTSTSNTFTQNQRVDTGGTSALYLGSSNRGLKWDGTALAVGWETGGTFIAFNSGNLESSTSDTRKPGGGSWTSSSDARLKENIVDYTKGLSAVKALRPVNYNYNDETKLGVDTNHKTYIGLIAQEVEQTPFTDMVSEGADGYKNVDSSQLVYALVNAVKELSAQVDTLKAEVTALKGA